MTILKGRFRIHFVGMLQSKLALINLNFKCYIQFFLSEHELDPLPGNPRIGQHPGKGGVKFGIFRD